MTSGLIDLTKKLTEHEECGRLTMDRIEGIKSHLELMKDYRNDYCNADVVPDFEYLLTALAEKDDEINHHRLVLGESAKSEASKDKRIAELREKVKRLESLNAEIETYIPNYRKHCAEAQVRARAAEGERDTLKVGMEEYAYYELLAVSGELDADDAGENVIKLMRKGIATTALAAIKKEPCGRCGGNGKIEEHAHLYNCPECDQGKE